MKIRKMTVIAAIAVAGIINASCGNKQQQANSEGATTEVVASGADGDRQPFGKCR